MKSTQYNLEVKSNYFKTFYVNKTFNNFEIYYEAVNFIL